jgi:molybdate transport system substrate-binding protein
VTKINLGEVDAGLIYRTDAIASRNIDAIEFPEAKSFSTTYSAVKLASSQKNVATRDAFLDYLSSVRAEMIFLNAGFGKT